MSKSDLPREFEQMVLLAILQCDEQAFAPDVAAELEQRAGRRVSRGALYATLERLEDKGWVRWQLERPAGDRGGYRKRRFEVTNAGLSALREARDAMSELARGLESVLRESAR